MTDIRKVTPEVTENLEALYESFHAIEPSPSSMAAHERAMDALRDFIGETRLDK